MYLKILLTIIALALTIIAIELARPSAPAVVPSLPQAIDGELKLAQKIPELKFTGITVNEAVDVLRKKTGANLVVEAESFYSDPDTQAKVNLELHDVTLMGAVRALFPDADANVRDNIITISGRYSQAALSVRVYNVEDLLSDDYWGIVTPPSIAPAVNASRLDALVKTVTDTVSPAVWNSSGAAAPGVASVTPVGRKLVVLQSTGGHHAVAQFLALLRRAGKWPNGTVGEQ